MVGCMLGSLLCSTLVASSTGVTGVPTNKMKGVYMDEEDGLKSQVTARGI